MDWNWLKYMGLVILGFSKIEFWDSSLREINDLIQIHIEVNDPDHKPRDNQNKLKQKLTPIDMVF